MREKTPSDPHQSTLAYFGATDGLGAGRFSVTGQSIDGGLNRLIEELEIESDRGCVIISVSLIEEMLRTLLISWAQSSSEMEELTSPAGPLGATGAMAKLCRALGLLTSIEFKTVNMLQKIRNKFAHRITTSFAEASVVDQCRCLELAGDFSSYPTRDGFLANALVLLLEMADRPADLKTVRRNLEIIQTVKTRQA